MSHRHALQLHILDADGKLIDRRRAYLRQNGHPAEASTVLAETMPLTTNLLLSPRQRRRMRHKENRAITQAKRGRRAHR